MKHQKLHEIAKFGAGLIAGDLCALWWMTSHKILPTNIMGIAFNQSMVIPAMIFDIALLLILIHYGWNIGKSPAVRERAYLLLAGIVFGVLAVVHLARVFFGTDFIIAGWEVPIWMSWVETVVAFYLTYMSFRLASRMK